MKVYPVMKDSIFSGIIVFQLIHFCSAKNCGYSKFMQADGGDEIIISPRYPLKYENNLYCVWYMSVIDDEYARIKISFEEFEVQYRSRDGDCIDWVKLFNSNSRDVKDLIGVFCGHSAPNDLKSGRHLTVEFKTDGVMRGKGFKIKLSVIKSNDPLDGLQSTAAILGGISSFIFIALLLCLVSNKHWSRNNSNSDETYNNRQIDAENDFDDVIQAAAPPSYNIVMEDPDSFPPTPRNTTPQESPRSIRSYNQHDIPAVEPPEYPAVVMKESRNLQVATLLLPSPSYEEVSESDDEWFPLSTKGGLRRKNKLRDIEDTENPPPSYLSVTSEGSDIDLRPISDKRVRSKFKTRSSRTSISIIPQAQRNNPESSDEEDAISNRPNVRIRLLKRKSNKELKLEPASEEAALLNLSKDNGTIISKQMSTKDDNVLREDDNKKFESEPVLFRSSINNDDCTNDERIYQTDSEAGTNQKETVKNKTFSPVLDRYANNLSSYNKLARHAILNNSFRNNEACPNTSIAANNIDKERE